MICSHCAEAGVDPFVAFGCLRCSKTLVACVRCVARLVARIRDVMQDRARRALAGEGTLEGLARGELEAKHTC